MAHQTAFYASARAESALPPPPTCGPELHYHERPEDRGGKDCGHDPYWLSAAANLSTFTKILVKKTSEFFCKISRFSAGKKDAFEKEVCKKLY